MRMLGWGSAPTYEQVKVFHDFLAFMASEYEPVPQDVDSGLDDSGLVDSGPSGGGPGDPGTGCWQPPGCAGGGSSAVLVLPLVLFGVRRRLAGGRGPQ